MNKKFTRRDFLGTSIAGTVGGLLHSSNARAAAFFNVGAFWKSSATATSAKTYIEDVFSTYAYTGNGSTQTITNGIDLAGKGGMVWTKGRGAFSESHGLVDTVRGSNRYLNSNNADIQGTGTQLTSFNSNGYTLGAVNGWEGNTNGRPYVGWTFRKAAKFFDVVTYTGNGTTKTINHNLGVKPGMIIIKCTSESQHWVVAHFDGTDYRVLYLDGALANNWAGTNPSANNLIQNYDNTTFTVSQMGGPYDPTGSFGDVQYSTNGSGKSYIAYIYAHDSSTDGLIQCGSFTPDGSNNADITLGWEPQLLLFKKSGAIGEWNIVDTSRGMSNSPPGYLRANLSDSELVSGSSYVAPTATGFAWRGVSSGPLIYVAIRRGPMRKPTIGTQVYQVQTWSFNAVGTPPYNIAALTNADMVIGSPSSAGSIYGKEIVDRLRGGKQKLGTTGTGTEASGSYSQFDEQGFRFDLSNGGTYVAHLFRRYPGVFDQVCYTGTGATRTVTHNLSVAPEMMIVRRRSGSEAGGAVGYWFVYHSGLSTPASSAVFLNVTDGRNGAGVWNNTAPNSTTFTVENNYVNYLNDTYVAYLFASLPGISKVFSYVGNGSSQTINCGFTNGARLILIKRTDNTGDWYVWDNVRGIVAGNDPHLSLNSTAAEVTSDDSVDPDSSGFIVNQIAATNINVSSATYIGLAIS